MTPINVGLMADPAKPTIVARGLGDLRQPDDSAPPWDVEVVSEPFTTGAEDAETALSRLGNHADQRSWDVVVGLTELPLREDGGRYLLVDADAQRRTAVVSLPALGGFRMHVRSRRAVLDVVSHLADPAASGECRVPLPRLTGRLRLIAGMVMANRPWLLVPGLKSALVAALTTGAIATINSTVWLLAGSLAWWRLVLATVASIGLVIAWLVIDGELWDRP